MISDFPMAHVNPGVIGNIVSHHSTWMGTFSQCDPGLKRTVLNEQCLISFSGELLYCVKYKTTLFYRLLKRKNIVYYNCKIPSVITGNAIPEMLSCEKKWILKLMKCNII